MNPVVREFFRGLKERDELDAILTELLTAMGFEVISRPMIGTVQYGADVAAIGTDDDNVRKLFLFAIKRGDLGREGWDNGVQALRPSLNQIRDAYLLGVAPEHKNLPVVVVATIGGVLLETAKLSVNGYLQTEGRPGLEFRLWTGDTLTAKIVDGAIWSAQHLLPLYGQAIINLKAEAPSRGRNMSVYHRTPDPFEMLWLHCYFASAWVNRDYEPKSPAQNAIDARYDGRKVAPPRPSAHRHSALANRLYFITRNLVVTDPNCPLEQACKRPNVAQADAFKQLWQEREDAHAGREAFSAEVTSEAHARLQRMWIDPAVHRPQLIEVCGALLLRAGY